MHCPFHGGQDTPSFSISKEMGIYFCFNPSCNESGNLVTLVKHVLNVKDYPALRLIAKHKNATDTILPEMQIKPPKFTAFDQGKLDELKKNFWLSNKALNYMRGRKFDDETLDYFDVGYSIKRDMIIVPMHDPTGVPIGLVARSIDTKNFSHSVGLEKSKTMWNYHRAKSKDSVIIAEASFDAMRIHQAGYPNVVALLMGSITKSHIEQINKTFNEVIIMTDNDKLQYYEGCRKCAKECLGHSPGRQLGQSIADKISSQVKWACSGNEIYPHEAKDAGDMSQSEIKHCIESALVDFEYQQMLQS